MKPRSVCLIAGGISSQNFHLQPWRYLWEAARGLAAAGHAVLLVTDQEDVEDPGESVEVCRLDSVRSPTWWRNKDLGWLLQQYQPEVTLWHTGLLSFVHQDYSISASPKNVGVFTSLIYSFGDLIQLGPGRLLRRLPVTGAHLAGSCLPRRLLRTMIERSQLDVLVVQTQTTRRHLRELGVQTKPILVIPPGVDPQWSVSRGGSQTPSLSSDKTHKDVIVFVYFGPAEELRGFNNLLVAFAAARDQDPSLQLQVMVRRDGSSDPHRSISLKRIAAGISCPCIQFETDQLSSAELAARVAASDVVVLPFELVSSDAPLSLIEATALGKPLVTTQVACLPELATPVPHFFARPGQAGSLAQVLLQAAGYVRAQGRAKAKSGSLLSGEVRLWREVGQVWSNLIQSL